MSTSQPSPVAYGSETLDTVVSQGAGALASAPFLPSLHMLTRTSQA